MMIRAEEDEPCDPEFDLDCDDPDDPDQVDINERSGAGRDRRHSNGGARMKRLKKWLMRRRCTHLKEHEEESPLPRLDRV